MISAIKPYGIQSVNYQMPVKQTRQDVEKPVPEQTEQAPTQALRAYAFAGNNVSFTGINLGELAGKTGGFISEYFMPAANPTKFKSFNEVVSAYTPKMRAVLRDFRERMGADGQFLKWTKLPEMQLARNEKGISHLDEVYSQALELFSRKNPDGSDRPLVVLGIGGSKHTAEFLANMAGVGNRGKLYFFSDIDPFSFKTFFQEIGKAANEVNVAVVSKSGTTFETKHGMILFENAIRDGYKAKGLSEEEAIAAAQKHFAIITDPHATDKNLRGKIGQINGERDNYLKELYVHDDVGGRYSMFDDEGLFTLAYAGVPKEFATRILHGANGASELCLAGNIRVNPAAKGAIFNNFSRDNGFGYTQELLFGRPFVEGGENWTKQLYLESLKDFNFSVGAAPAREHYATEGDFFPANRKLYNTIMTMLDPNMSTNWRRYLSALADTYNETTPVKINVLKTEGSAITPEAIGRFIQEKHFETVYEGMLRREIAKAGSNKSGLFPKGMPEVTQDSVEAYKNKFKLGEYQLNPGE